MTTAGDRILKSAKQALAFAEGKKSIKSDLARLDAMTEEDIDYSDIPELDDSFFEKASVTLAVK